MTLRFSQICKCTCFFDNFQEKSFIRNNVIDYLMQLGIPAQTGETSADYIPEEENTEKIQKVGKCCKRTPKKPDKIKKTDTPLELMPKRIVTLRTGQVLQIPAPLHEMCNYVLRNAEVKYLFKKPGNTAIQEDIQNLLDKGEHLPQENLNVIDVANIILKFLNQLQVPVIPHCQHRLFLSCYDHPDREDVLVLAILLLPPNHVNLLTYLMQFFDQVSLHNRKNNMSRNQLATQIAPIIMPVKSPENVKKTEEIIVIFMQRADLLGMVPEVMTRTSDPRNKPLSRKISDLVDHIRCLLNKKQKH